MANITCAISGVAIEIPMFSKLYINSSAGYVHPIFAASPKQLDSLYVQHTRNKLMPKESMLLFLAMLHQTGKVVWNTTVTLEPTSRRAIQLIEKALPLLIEVTAQTNIIRHPKFKQPSFKVTTDNSSLYNIVSYLEAWQLNITLFKQNNVNSIYTERLKKVENKFTHMIKSNIPLQDYTNIVAEWADKVAGFPNNQKEYWKKIIRLCFTSNRICNIPLQDIKSVKEYCECNIEIGSIHYFKLMEVLKTGIINHAAYLGNYSLLAVSSEVGKNYLQQSTVYNAESEIKNQEAVASIIATAPEKPPVESDYPNKLAFIKAKLAYRIASSKPPADMVPVNKSTGYNREKLIADAANKITKAEQDEPIILSLDELTKEEECYDDSEDYSL